MRPQRRFNRKRFFSSLPKPNNQLEKIEINKKKVMIFEHYLRVSMSDRLLKPINLFQKLHLYFYRLKLNYNRYQMRTFRRGYRFQKAIVKKNFIIYLNELQIEDKDKKKK